MYQFTYQVAITSISRIHRIEFFRLVREKSGMHQMLPLEIGLEE